MGASTGAAGEALEGLRLSVGGVVVEAPSALSDGLGVTIDDGSGALRIVVGAVAQAAATIRTGDTITAVGPLGQRDSSGTGLAGYRLHATLPGELAVSALPSPSVAPSASPAPTPQPSAQPTPSATSAPSASSQPGSSVTPAPSATPSPSATRSQVPPTGATAISVARTLPIGRKVTIGGVVTAEAGRLGSPPLISIQDATAAIVVRLPDTALRPARGMWVELTGTLADPYGQLEVRGLVGGLTVIGPAALPTPVLLDGRSIGDAVETRLALVDGTVAGRPTKATSGDFTFNLTTAGGTVRIAVDGSAGIAASAVSPGDSLRLTGIVGQRASRKGAADGFRIWLRDRSDIVRAVGGGSPSPTPSPGASGSPSGPSAGGNGAIAIAAAIVSRSGTVTVEGSVICGPRLLDSTARRIVVEDLTGAVEILLPKDRPAPSIGSRVRVTGEIGRAYGAPRIAATSVTVLGSASVAPLDMRVAPGTAHEWRLVRVRGDIVDMHRSGDRWAAELLVAGQRVPIVGLAGAAIPASAVIEGRTATIVGMVRRPYPTATDRRFAIVPRSAADVTIGGPSDDATSSGSTTPGGPGGNSGASAGPSGFPGSAGGLGPGGTPVDVDLVTLDDHAGALVRVGGLVEDIAADRFRTRRRHGRRDGPRARIGIGDDRIDRARQCAQRNRQG